MRNKNYIITAMCLFLVFITGFSQTKNDLILTKSQDIIEAKVILLGDTRVQYKLPNNDRVNEISVSNLIKIKFANGTEKIFNKKIEEKVIEIVEEVYEYPEFDKNLIAIIPFDFYDEGTGRSLGRKGLEVQKYIERRLMRRRELKVLDVRETNFRLKKAKVDYTKLESYRIQELSKILGAGTIITGGVKFIFQETVVFNEYYTPGTTDIIVDEGLHVSDDGDIAVTQDIYEVSSGGGWDVDVHKFSEFETKTTMEIYENNQRVFEEERDPVFNWGDADDWKGNIDWLLKKSPYRLPRP